MATGYGGVTAKLLVVDDEARTAELTAELLRRAGYTVEVAASGTEAVARARSNAPDLMLLDYEMPDMQAPEVLDELRSGADRVAFPVIIFTGARHSPGDQVLGIERGATDYIAKGIDRDVLLARVRGALREHASAERVLVRGRLRIDTAKGQAFLESKALKLERRPLLMLEMLAAREGDVVTRAELL
jgi:DNA-binding response OmpR family regulator